MKSSRDWIDDILLNHTEDDGEIDDLDEIVRRIQADALRYALSQREYDPFFKSNITKLANELDPRSEDTK